MANLQIATSTARPRKRQTKQPTPRYRTYAFQDYDPVRDVLNKLIETSGKSIAALSEESGVAAGTFYRWSNGKTRRPQFCTIAAAVGAMGKSIAFVNKRGAGIRNAEGRNDE